EAAREEQHRDRRDDRQVEAGERQRPRSRSGSADVPRTRWRELTELARLLGRAVAVGQRVRECRRANHESPCYGQKKSNYALHEHPPNLGLILRGNMFLRG